MQGSLLEDKYTLQLDAQNCAQFVRIDRKPCLNFSQWCECFDIFIAAYLGEHPQKTPYDTTNLAQELLTYHIIYESGK